MTTQCIEVSLEDDPMEVLKGCIVLLGSLDSGYVEDHYSDLGIKVLADVMRDAVSRVDEEKKKRG